MAPAVALPEDEGLPRTNGTKRRLSESPEAQEENGQEQKRQRISPGKNSPAAPRDKDASPNAAAKDIDKPEQPTYPREVRRKSGIADEKQRSKRLFGALLGSLNQPRDRTSKRRQEIESRRKAELQRQDDERLEDKQRRQERLADQRKKVQLKIDEEDMDTRHRNMLDRARYLQTESEPRLFYKPWDLRPDEEDRIQDQIRDAQTQIDKELDEFDARHAPTGDAKDVDLIASEVPKTNGTSDTNMDVDKEVEVQQSESDVKNEGNEVTVTSTTDTAKPDEVPESPLDKSANQSSPKSESEEKTALEVVDNKMENVEEEHIVGEEDSVIY